MDKINKDNITKSLSNKTIRKIRRLITKRNTTDTINENSVSIVKYYKLPFQIQENKYLVMSDWADVGAVLKEGYRVLGGVPTPPKTPVFSLDRELTGKQKKKSSSCRSVLEKKLSMIFFFCSSKMFQVGKFKTFPVVV